MGQALSAILDSYRQSAKTQREKGTYFERLCIAFLKNDPLQITQYDEVWSFSDWAEAQGIDRRDTGIDLVARMRDGSGFCAIQCKFYDEDKRISKSEVASFFTASGKAPFARRLIIDTTDAEWSEHAEAALGVLHVDYETVDPYPVTIKQGDLRLANIVDPEKFYRGEKTKFVGKRANLDKSTVIYNANITMSDIPLDAYDYVVNGKPALEWVIERQCVKADKASGIVNDANRYAIETVGNPAYPLELSQRVITVSLETMKIVRSLPALDID